MALLVFALPLTVNAEEIIKKGESLNLERCIEIAGEDATKHRCGCT